MERNLLINTYPQSKLVIEQSLGISLLTNIQLVDYFLNSSANQIESIQYLSDLLPKEVKENLHILRTVFAHGVILRDFYISNVNDINQDCEGFIGWWEALQEEEVVDLMIYGIQEAIHYYNQYIPKIESVEKTLQEVTLTNEHLRNVSNRRKALKAVLLSWSIENVEEVLPFYDDIGEVKERILNLIHEFWEAGFKDIWQLQKNKLDGWQSKTTSLLHKSYGTNVEGIYAITGLYPDTNDIEKINRAHLITFIPVPNMGRLMTYFQFENQMFLMFEPSVDEHYEDQTVIQNEDVFTTFEGLGDATRLQIISLLAKQKEMYAQQIITELGLKQSTVSRHLNQLHQANLVLIRQVGNTKYYSMNQAEIRRVMQVLEDMLK
ncbi:ArsR/SmtB family transcription factor [Ornithinibacillus halotolerans]|uniref:HTH arsR-type domain-containing protein n=1 Tax=Ornithinibacillus halotolerans TaxID=1274357 RepID=A0A916RS83_9BACI|nr:metalloregulator ArsR/SmtB family transcription factor [Ornithinibacillus halotolerans]GGA67925.1 hypothetical protein GCM10008025_09730 [Ornithinibacillus halotolerans]